MKVVSESYDNRRPIIKRESLRGLFVRDDRMILEVGAGGCIMITPPAKGSALEKAMNGEKIGGVTISSLQQGDFNPGRIEFNTGDKEPDYVRWTNDVFKRDEQGKPVIDVNGNFVFLHRAGDIMFDSKGDPIFASREKPKFNVMDHPAPRIVSDGIRDGQQHHDPVETAISRLEYWSKEEFEDLLDKVQKETRRRLTSGGPASRQENPHTVASI